MEGLVETDLRCRSTMKGWLDTEQRERGGYMRTIVNVVGVVRVVVVGVQNQDLIRTSSHQYHSSS